tara:strand:+ start:17624 stop:18121 length:498 start_codon:yes stop_codon:yes gene_type:complete
MVRINNQDLFRYSLEEPNNYYVGFNRTTKYKENKFYSYKLMIGEIINKNQDNEYYLLYGKTAIYNNFISFTTSKHFNMLRRELISQNKKYMVVDRHLKVIEKNFKKDYDIKRIEIKENDKELICPITLEPIKDFYYLTSCNHKFSDSLHKWTEKCSNCPLCRSVL